MPRTNLNGNLIYNGNFEIAPPFTAGSTTANTWIDGTAAGSTALKAYGWAIPSGAIAASAAAQFDTSISHSGTNSLKLSTLNVTGAITVSSFKTAAASDLFLISPSTTYTLTFWLKTNNVATNGAFIDFRLYTNAAATITTTSTTKLSGTNDWTQITLSLATGGTAYFGGLFLRNNVTGNVSDAWFDDIVLAPATTVTRTVAS
jgi:hypothetical protein